jgi:hypothetical protein
MDFPLDPHETLRLKAIAGLGVEAWLPAETLDRSPPTPKPTSGCRSAS